MKKLSSMLAVVGLVISLFMQLIIMSPVVVSASKTPAVPVDPCSEASESPFCNNKTQNPPATNAVNDPLSPILGRSSIFYKIIQTVTLLTGAISIIMIMVGGFRYIVSGGDSTATKAAKDTILYAVIGLAIAIFAQTIITFVLSNI